jgi:hypothetical protein
MIKMGRAAQTPSLSSPGCNRHVLHMRVCGQQREEHRYVTMQNY